jgi:hypothetical protein
VDGAATDESYGTEFLKITTDYEKVDKKVDINCNL